MNHSFEVVAIWEAAYHNEVLEAYVHHFSQVSKKIILFTHSFHWEQAVSWRDRGHLDWILKDNQKTWPAFFQSQHEKLSTCSWLITTSLPDENEDKKPIKFPSPAWLVIHNAMFSLGKNKRRFYLGKYKLLDMAKIARYWWENKSTKTDQLVGTFENVIFPTKAIRDYCRAQNIWEQEGAVIPFYYPKALVKKPVKNQFTIVIPGTVNPQIRDYNLVASILPEILKHSPLPVGLILLGKVKGKEAKKIVKQICELVSEDFQFQFFTDFITQEIFETHLGNADMILAPLLEKARYDAIEEEFGYTTESGNLADIISNQIPGVIPSFYPIPEEFSQLIDRYSNASSLTDIILEKIRLKNQGFTTERASVFPPSFADDVARQIMKQWHDFRTFQGEVDHAG